MSPVPGGQVDEEVVGLVPVHVGEELLERLVQHRAPPDDRLVLLGEEAHRDAAHAVGLGRDEHLVDHDRRAVDAEHAGDREAPHVGVDDGDRLAPLGEGDGQVGGDRRLADAALARRDQQHPGRGCRVGEGDGPALGVAVGRLACRRWPPGRRGAARAVAARSSSVIDREVEARPSRPRRAPVTAAGHPVR